MKRGHGIFVTCQRFTAFVPSQRQTWSVALVARVHCAELEGAKTCVFSQMRRSDLIGGDAVAKASAGFGIAIRASEPEGATPMGLVAKFVGAPLYYGEVFLESCKWSKARRSREGRSCLFNIWEPSLTRHAPTNPQKNNTLGNLNRLSGDREALETEGFQKGQSNAGTATTQKMATRDKGWHLQRGWKRHVVAVT